MSSNFIDCKNLLYIGTGALAFLGTYYYFKKYSKINPNPNPTNSIEITEVKEDWKIKHEAEINEMWKRSNKGKCFAAVCCNNPICNMATRGTCLCAKQQYISKLRYDDVLKFQE